MPGGVIKFVPILAKVMKFDKVRLNLLTLAHKTEREVKAEFKKTVETWEHPVEFKSKISLVNGPTVEVWTEDKIYGWVDDGTPEHEIVAKNKPNLVYNKKFKSKTVPRKISSRKGRSYGHIVKRKSVVQSITPREFSKTIARRYEPKFKRNAKEAVASAMREINSGGK